MGMWDSVVAAGGAVEDMASNAISSIGQKVTELASAIGLTDAPSKVPGQSNVVPSQFKAFTSGQLTTYALDNVNTKFSPQITSLLGSTGAMDVASLNPSNIETMTSDFAVMLMSQQTKDAVKFRVMPGISEQRGASYEEVAIAQHPGAILKYQTTSNREWSLSVKLITRNSEEASENQITLNTLRSWLMPYYGDGTEKNSQANGMDMLGAPPDVLDFTAYGDKNIGKVPVVLASLGVTWPNDVDYLPTLDGQPFPVILTLDISLKEAWSPKEYTAFDLYAYKQGNMANAYNPGANVVKQEINPDAQTGPVSLLQNTAPPTSILQNAAQNLGNIPTVASSLPSNQLDSMLGKANANVIKTASTAVKSTAEAVVVSRPELANTTTENIKLASGGIAKVTSGYKAPSKASMSRAEMLAAGIPADMIGPNVK